MTALRSYIISQTLPTSWLTLQVASDGKSHQITDLKLAAYANELILSIRANLIIRQHSMIMGSFKQWVFPFAEVFLDDFDHLEVPQNIRADFCLNSFADKAAEQIKSIRRKLIEYKSTIMQHDRLICRGHFNSQFVSTRPFFVWENRRTVTLASKSKNS
jgi:hypothetical protein